MTLVGDARNALVVGLVAGKNKQAEDHHVNELEPGPLQPLPHHLPHVTATTLLSSGCPITKGQAHKRMNPAPVPRLGPSLWDLFYIISAPILLKVTAAITTPSRFLSSLTRFLMVPSSSMSGHGEPELTSTWVTGQSPLFYPLNQLTHQLAHPPPTGQRL